MIDTIGFKIHNFNRFYPNALKRIFLLGKTDKKSRFQSNQNLVAGKIFQSFHSFIRIPSSGYDINFFYTENDDQLKVSLSIPKFYYGQNVSQHINRSFPVLDVQLRFQLQLIHNFFADFCRNILAEPIDGQDIEIERLDFCFNIIFSTKQKSLEFLQMIKESRIKYLGDRSNLYVYNTSIQYRGDGYSWKFYHKGTESKRSLDEKTLVIADRIMRFEVTVRRRKMSLICSKMHPGRDQENDTKMKFFASGEFSYPNTVLTSTHFETIGLWYLDKFIELIPIENYTYSFDIPEKIRAYLINGGLNDAMKKGLISKRTFQRYQKKLRDFNKDMLKTKLDFDVTYQTYIDLAPIFALNIVKPLKINSWDVLCISSSA